MSKELADRYLQKISAKVKSSSNTAINIKCPLCNEGHSTHKARGYVLLSTDRITYFCHNCLTEGLSFYNFLNQVDHNVAEEYRQETRKQKLNSFTTSKSYNEQIKEAFKVDKTAFIQEYNPEPIEETYGLIIKKFEKGIYTINDKDQEYALLDLSEEALSYLYSRGFTDEDIWDLKFIKESGDIVFPLWFDRTRNLVYGMQMRNIYEKRFHNQNFKENPKVWNLPYCLSLPKGSRIYITESIIDAMSTGFDNIIASIGRTISKDILDLFKGYELIFLFDADYAGDQSSLKYAQLGYKCLLHKKELYDFKDFNKLLELGQTKEAIQSYIIDNTASPLKVITTLKLKGVSLKN